MRLEANLGLFAFKINLRVFKRTPPVKENRGAHHIHYSFEIREHNRSHPVACEIIHFGMNMT